MSYSFSTILGKPAMAVCNGRLECGFPMVKN